MNKNIELTDRFNSLLVEYLNTFNLLELNVGLCISHLSKIEQHEIYKKINKMSFEKKLEYLLELTSSEENKQDLYFWCKDAHSKRHERNMYMHGQWYLIPHLDQCVEFRIAPWVKDKYANVYPGSRFTFHQLESIVTSMKSCLEAFFDLRKKYGI